MSFSIAIVGRPNVGKSTLFNRLAGKRLAIVDDTPGVTRDRRVAPGSLADLEFTIVDTAGLEDAAPARLETRMSQQTQRAARSADVVLFLIDGRAGVTPGDRHFADVVRSLDRPTLLLVNKCEGKAAIAGLGEAHGLGLGEPIAISAEHGEGLSELYDALKPFAETAEGQADAAEGAEDETDAATRPFNMAIVGRPNVGKSTLINRLLGEERMLTGPEAGITRDAIASEWNWKGRRIKLVDTAGMRRRANVFEKLEKLSVADSLRAIQYAEVVVLVLDAEAMLEKQDLAIARLVEDEGRGLVIVVNKWDKIDAPAKALRKLNDRLETSLAQLKGVPVVTVSALTGKGLDRLMPTVLRVNAAWNKRIGTGELNRWLAPVLEGHPPPLNKGRRIKIRYMTQAKARPPTFAVFASQPTALPESYARYLVNALRQRFKLEGVPIRITVKRGANPFDRK
jgi:GTP-binding protein